MILLLDVLEENRAIANRGTIAVRVSLADSGLYRTGINPFAGVVVPVTSGKSIEPLQRSPELGHGTQVASLLLGGPLFSRFHALALQRIRLDVARIYQLSTDYRKDVNSGETRLVSGFGVDQIGFDRFLLDSAQSQIVNLSIKSDDEIPALWKMLTPDSHTLFVAAAGNDDGKLGASATQIYPAVYGGPTRNNLIVVAAVDGNNEVAKFSNSGADWVEIGAPGCAVAALSYDPDTRVWRTEYISGTSVAAPLVSFTAALIESEHGDQLPAVDVKRRLLAAADLNPDPKVSDAISDGRTLNMPKAVNLFNDSLELKDDPNFIIGRVTFLSGAEKQPKSDRGVIELDCHGKAAYRIDHILKLSPNYGHASATRLKLYYQTDDRSLFQNKDCRIPDDLAVLVHDVFRDEDHEFPLEHVKDYIRRFEVNW
jgi:subtilisin family serine protease